MSKRKEAEDLRHRGRIAQIPLYVKKFFRMFFFMNDWMVLPMSALVAAVSAIVVSKNMFVTMEGTLKGSLALSCICIWNGFFNSIQSICRERDIVKREHRNGMYVTSYISAHMIYQAFICLCQTAITMGVCKLGGMNFKSDTMTSVEYHLYIGITLFLITYSADMMSLMISAIARTTTMAMTVMPFMLIFELVFSNSIFKIGGRLGRLTDLSIAKWGLRCIAGQAHYNSLPFMTAWNQLSAWKSMEYEGIKPVEMLMESIDKDSFCALAGEKNFVADYASTPQNISTCWMALILFSIIFVMIAIIALKRIDNDKR